MATILAIRAVHVAQGITCVVTARSAYRRPRLAIAVERRIAGRAGLDGQARLHPRRPRRDDSQS